MKQIRKHAVNRSKLSLHRTTLRVLSAGGLAKVAGGGPNGETETPTCSSSRYTQLDTDKCM